MCSRERSERGEILVRFLVILSLFERGTCILKKGVKGDYTMSYKILVTQDSYRAVSDSF